MSDNESCHDDEKEIVDDSEDENPILEAKTFADVEACMSRVATYFREFELSLLKFVEFELNINANLVPDSSELSNSLRMFAKLNPNLLYFILSDANKKIQIILKPKSTSKLLGFPGKPSKTQLFLQLNNTNPKDTANFIMDNCFDKLCDHLDCIYKHIKAIQRKNDDIKDPPEIQNNQNNICLLRCLNQILKLMHMLFVWLYSVNDAEFSAKMPDLIKQLAGKCEVKRVTQAAATQLEKHTKLLGFKFLSNLSEICLDLYTADVLAQLMDFVLNKIFMKHFNLDEEMRKKCRHFLSETCRQFLKSDYNPKLATKQAVTSNESVGNILSIFLKNSEDPVSAINDLKTIMVSDEFRMDRQLCDDYETLKTNFSAYFKVLLEYTVNNLNFEILKNYDLKRDGLDEAILVVLVQKINALVEVHCSLIYLKKHVSFKDINILTLLKNSRLFINNFLKFTMPVLDKAFDSHRNEVVILLQKLQDCVHFLQEICLAKDQFSISKQMPVYLRCIEAFALRVKQLLYINSCDAAFTVNFEKFNVAEVGKKAGRKVLREKTTNPKRKPGKKDKKKEDVDEEEEPGIDNEIEANTNNDDDEEEEEDEDGSGNQTENDD